MGTGVTLVVIVASVATMVWADYTPSPSPSGAEFLQSVIGRIGDKQEEPQQLAKPVQDLQAALNRVTETLGGNQQPEASPGGLGTLVPSAPQASETMANNNDVLEAAPSSLFHEVDPGQLAITPGFAPPPLQAPPLSKDELSALYQAAINKGLALDLAALKGGYLPPQGLSSLTDQNSGYYYYFFPIKNLGEQTAQATVANQVSPIRSQFQVQATAQSQRHQHQQSVVGAGHQEPTLEQAAAAAAMGALGSDVNAIFSTGDSSKSVEPLFMAMAGFIGMALMFVLSVLFLPKGLFQWGALRSRGVTALKHAPDELASLTKLVVQSIEGKDCSERIACEVGRAVRTMRLGNKPLRVLEILLPPSLSKQITHIRKAAKKAEKCNFIPCKYRAVNPFKHLLPTKLLPSNYGAGGGEGKPSLAPSSVAAPRTPRPLIITAQNKHNRGGRPPSKVNANNNNNISNNNRNPT